MVCSRGRGKERGEGGEAKVEIKVKMETKVDPARTLLPRRCTAIIARAVSIGLSAAPSHSAWKLERRVRK